MRNGWKGSHWNNGFKRSCNALKEEATNLIETDSRDTLRCLVREQKLWLDRGYEWRCCMIPFSDVIAVAEQAGADTLPSLRQILK